MSRGGSSWQDESTLARPLRPTKRKLRPDHTHKGHQRRIARAVADRLSQVISFDERVLAFTEAIEHADLSTRAVLGPLWTASRRVALVFTGHRMIAIGLSATGRRALGGIRSFPWDRIPEFAVRGHWLELRTWTDATFKWYLRDDLDRSIEQLLRTQADLAVSTYQPTEIRSVPLRHCSHCGLARIKDDGECQRCGRLLRQTSTARRLAVALPGAGHIYASRPLAGIVRSAVELAVFAGVLYAIATADHLRDGIAATIAGAVLLLAIKLQGAAAAGELAGRAETITDRARRRWRWLGRVGTLALAAAVACCPFAIGLADRDVSADLEILGSGTAWVGYRAPPPSDDPTLRSRWRNPDGWEVLIRGTPFRRFESADAARRRVAGDVGSSGDLLTVGPHRAVAGIQRSGPADDVALVNLAVFDTAGRDVHVLSSRVEPDRAAAAQQVLADLLTRAVWVPATAP